MHMLIASPYGPWRRGLAATIRSNGIACDEAETFEAANTKLDLKPTCVVISLVFGGDMKGGLRIALEAQQRTSATLFMIYGKEIQDLDTEMELTLHGLDAFPIRQTSDVSVLAAGLLRACRGVPQVGTHEPLVQYVGRLLTLLPGRYTPNVELVEALGVMHALRLNGTKNGVARILLESRRYVQRRADAAAQWMAGKGV